MERTLYAHAKRNQKERKRELTSCKYKQLIIIQYRLYIFARVAPMLTHRNQFPSPFQTEAKPLAQNSGKQSAEMKECIVLHINTFDVEKVLQALIEQIITAAFC